MERCSKRRSSIRSGIGAGAATAFLLLEAKFRKNLTRKFPARQQARILEASLDQGTLEAMAVHEYVDLYVI